MVVAVATVSVTPTNFVGVLSVTHPVSLSYNIVLSPPVPPTILIPAPSAVTLVADAVDAIPTIEPLVANSPVPPARNTSPVNVDAAETDTLAKLACPVIVAPAPVIGPLN